MGMAASQARFLCLTARKSNTEYQGQQVNQQRTLLANESAGLYNRMLAMEVPVPPSSSDYYKKTYQFVPAEGSDSKYKFTTSPKLIGPNLYQIGVSWDADKIEMRSKLATMSAARDEASGEYKEITFNGKNYSLTKMNFDTNKDSMGYGYNVTGRTAEADGTYKWDKNSINMAVNKSQISGGEDDEYYCFETTTDDGKPLQKYYISSSTLSALSGDSSIQSRIDYDVTVKGQDYGYIQGRLEKSDSGRYDRLFVTKSDIDEAFAGATEDSPLGPYELSITEVRDDEAYDEAMKDYEYKKDQYDKEIQDINSKTALIQQKDKSLELKLKQLDTEQEALKNELEAVQEVINKNVESTFKTFSA